MKESEKCFQEKYLKDASFEMSLINFNIFPFNPNFAPEVGSDQKMFRTKFIVFKESFKMTPHKNIFFDNN